jgi:hypothetical protein
MTVREFPFNRPVPFEKCTKEEGPATELEETGGEE